MAFKTWNSGFLEDWQLQYDNNTQQFAMLYTGDTDLFAHEWQVATQSEIENRYHHMENVILHLCKRAGNELKRGAFDTANNTFGLATQGAKAKQIFWQIYTAIKYGSQQEE